MSYVTAKLRQRLRRAQDEATFLNKRLERERYSVVERVTLAHDWAKNPPPPEDDPPVYSKTTELLHTQPGEKLCRNVLGLGDRQGRFVARVVSDLLEACVDRRQIPLRVTYDDRSTPFGVGTFTLHSFKVKT